MKIQKSRVNLYCESLQPKKIHLSFKRLFIVTLSIPVLTGVMGAWLYFKIASAEQELNTEQQRKQELSQQQEQYQKKLDNHKADAALIKEVELATQQLEIKKQLLNELAHRDDVQSQSYLQLLRDLANMSDGQSWLTRIQVDELGLQLSGQTRNAASVPSWLQKLESAESIAGSKFGSIKFTREQDGIIEFQLMTDVILDEDGTPLDDQTSPQQLLKNAQIMTEVATQVEGAK